MSSPCLLDGWLLSKRHSSNLVKVFFENRNNHHLCVFGESDSNVVLFVVHSSFNCELDVLVFFNLTPTNSTVTTGTSELTSLKLIQRLDQW